MKVAVVAYEMEGARTGVGRYLEGLLLGLRELGAPDVRFELFFKGDPFEHPLWQEMRPHFDRRPNAHPILWEQLRLPRLLRRSRRREDFDLVFSPAYSLPPLPTDAAGMVTVHDLSFEHLGREFAWKERWRRRFLARRAVRRAARVLADTGAIARDLGNLYGLPADKLAVVPLGVDRKFLDAAACGEGDEADAATLESVGVRTPYLLFVGSILPRRHVELVIAAFAAVAVQRPELRLVIAGANRLRQPRDLDRWIGASGFAERILRVGYVPENALVTLYRHAELSYYLSSYEGYGLPPLESLAAGTPAVVGSGLALDDLWPEYPYRCARLEAARVVEQTRNALADDDERRRVGQEGRDRMARLSWRHAADLFLAEARRAAGLGEYR